MSKEKEALLMLMQHCKNFIKEQEIICPEHIYQCDNVILNAAQFIEGVCNIVGYMDIPDDEE